MADFEFNVVTARPSMKIVYQIVGPLSVDDQPSVAWVGPTASTVTTGLVGAAMSPGNVTVTGLLELEMFPAASFA